MYATVVQTGTGPVRGAGARRGRLDRMKTGDGSPIHRRRRRTFFALRKCTSNGIAVDFWRGFHASRADGPVLPETRTPPLGRNQPGRGMKRSRWVVFRINESSPNVDVCSDITQI